MLFLSINLKLNFPPKEVRPEIRLVTSYVGELKSFNF